MAVFQLLGIGAVLKMLLERVLAYMAGWSDGRDGCLVDDGVARFLVCHGFDFAVLGLFWKYFGWGSESRTKRKDLIWSWCVKRIGVLSF